MNTHTPSPWELGRGSFGTPLIVTKEGDSIASVDLIQNAAFIVTACNAHADLLVALQNLCIAAENSNCNSITIDAARAAIARATGAV